MDRKCKPICIITILASLFFVTPSTVSAMAFENNLVIEGILDGYLSAKIPKASTILIGDTYMIYTSISRKSMGMAHVISIKNETCILEIEEKKNKKKISVGDLLVYYIPSEESAVQVLQAFRDHSFSTGGEVQKVDYYLEGKLAANKDYSGVQAGTGGLICGFGLGLVGWGIGYLVASGKGVNVPEHYTDGLDKYKREQFNDGFKDKVKSKRKASYNMGAAVGTIIAILYLSSVEQSD